MDPLLIFILGMIGAGSVDVMELAIFYRGTHPSSWPSKFKLPTYYILLAIYMIGAGVLVILFAQVSTVDWLNAIYMGASAPTLFKYVIQGKSDVTE
jgi:hypothetical protein